jgi:uncharacterized DUF497 family protein
MDFEWDPVKAKANEAKHRVEFEAAAEVFFDPRRIVERDDSDPGEERWNIIGLAEGRLLFVVYTERDNDVTRIISARKATKREERDYFGQAAP